MKNYIVIGASRGLGAALVKELLNNKDFFVFAVSRTSPEEIPEFPKWQNSGRFKYFQVDIGNNDESIKKLSFLLNDLNKKPICVFYNAACLKSEMKDNNEIDFAIWEEINNTNINGLKNTVKCFENYLLNYNGIFVGISSFNAFFPSVIEMKIAYSASKAYLNSVLKCLKYNWRGKVKVLTVNLGHLGNNNIPYYLKFIVPSYEKTAKKIIKILSNTIVPEEINYPFIYKVFYRQIINFIPEKFYYLMFNIILKKLIIFIKKSKI